MSIDGKRAIDYSGTVARGNGSFHGRCDDGYRIASKRDHRRSMDHHRCRVIFHLSKRIDSMYRIITARVSKGIACLVIMLEAIIILAIGI